MVLHPNVIEGTNVLIDFQNTGPDDKYTENFIFKEVACVRRILNQYGWNTYDTRSLY